MRKKVGIIKRVFSIGLIFLLSINSFAAIVSDNDGSAFITKAEFDALKSSFQSQIDTYNQSIDSKIDGAIASYLAGIRLSNETELGNIYTTIKGLYGGKILWGAYTDNEEICTKNDAIPAGTTHNLGFGGISAGSNAISRGFAFHAKQKLTSMQYFTNGNSAEIDVFAPDPIWWVEVQHSNFCGYYGGQYAYYYQPKSSDDSTSCKLGQEDLKVGMVNWGTATYHTKSDTDYIWEIEIYGLKHNRGNLYNTYFLMLPNYDGRGRGNNAWLTNQNYTGGFRTRWDEQGYHTRVDTTQNTVGSSQAMHIVTKAWDRSTGNYVTGNSTYDGRKYEIGTANSDWQTSEQDLVANAKLYLAASDATRRKEIYPEIVRCGYAHSKVQFDSADRLYWGSTTTRITAPSSAVYSYAQNYQWLEGNRVSSGGKKLSELTLTKVKDLLGLNCTMATGVPIAKADKDGSVKITLKAAESGKYVIYNNPSPNSSLGTQYTATGSGTIDTINLATVAKNDYIFMKYLPNAVTELGYEVEIDEITLTSAD